LPVQSISTSIMKFHKDTWNIINQFYLITVLSTFFYFTSCRPTNSVQLFISITRPFFLLCIYFLSIYSSIFFQVFAKTKFCTPLFFSYICYMPFSFCPLLNHTIYVSNSFHATLHFVIFFSFPLSFSLS
jgi:hypothetical protein